ncbi:RNA-directed DNA polymerase from mobile element jockey-like [Brachionus plicatilis]|uniref:RNA-directed DNA polymerase from mobile element jockey-like n=1 Tax=Brachionus plicatilis TaxID=10195 RepID=A0A3M7SZI9_BRAPC|nr:RNA-directed DNA polymerase from mobile element jockey-like [Brachionus plicatilis]
MHLAAKDVFLVRRLGKHACQKRLEVIDWHISPLSVERRANHMRRREIVRNCRARSNFYTNRIGQHWNCLPDELANAESVNSFKNKLDQRFNCNRA